MLIEIESAAVGSGKIFPVTIVGDLFVFGHDQWRQRLTQIPNCDGEACEEDDRCNQPP
jgi:hypothetical protein